MSKSAENDRPNPIDSTTAGLIRRKAMQLVRRARLLQNSCDDLEQELTIDLLTRLPAFDPDRGDREVFVKVLLAHAAANLLRRLRTRPAPSSPLPSEVPARSGTAGWAHEVAEVLTTLPDNLQEIAELLASHTPTEVARELGLSRSTVYRRRRDLRALFERAGFRESP